MRVLKWIVDRCAGRVAADESPLGWMPRLNQFNIEGLKGYEFATLEKAFAINLDDWKREILMQDELFIQLYHDLPKEILFQKELLVSRL
jgi:phosphoenolpyruvate carboxykinase (GTP)